MVGDTKIERKRRNIQYRLCRNIIIIIILFLSINNIAKANTGINKQIPYTGSIISNNGTVLSDGNYRAKFIIYEVLSGGVALYEEIRDGSTSYAGTGVSPLLNINDGKFEILLGSQNTTNFTNILNNDTLYLELQLDIDNNGSYEEVFAPRKRIGSAVSAINALRLVADGGTSSNTLSLDSTGNIIASALGGTVNSSAPVGYDRVIIANSSGQFSQVNISTLGSSGWGLTGNSIASSANSIGVAGTGSFIGTTSAQSLQFITNNLVRTVITSAGDLLTSSNIIIGNGDTNATPVAGNLRVTNSSGSNIAGANLSITAGRGTGTGVGGSILFATSAAGTTGSSLNAATTRLQITGAGDILVPILGGTVNSSAPVGYDRVIIANSSGQFSQVNISTLGSSGWGLTGNATTSAWNGSSGSYLGTTSAQPLVLATTNATAQDIRFFTGANGANERMRITGVGDIGIGTTSPQARLDVNGGIRLGDATTCSSSNLGTLRYKNNTLQVCREGGWEIVSQLCPDYYIPVPGNSLYGTSDFCVMKYEAKTGSATVAATTQAAGDPTVNITQTNAITACSLNGAGYGLITNAEWMTIARNIEAQPSNWTGGAVGSGGLWRGHSDGSPNTAPAASTDDNLGYEGTGNTSPSIEKRTHSLSNGEVIWDLSGNVWEWTNDTIRGNQKPNNSSGSFWQEWTAISNFGTLSYDLTRPSNNTWNSTQNMGQYYAGGISGGSGNTTFAFFRGGRWDNTSAAGVFALNLAGTPSDTSFYIGFRCVVR